MPSLSPDIDAKYVTPEAIARKEARAKVNYGPGQPAFGLPNYAEPYTSGRPGGGKHLETADQQRKHTHDPLHFQRWFRGSKAVDDEGKPLVLYHGTKKAGFSEFDSDPHHLGAVFATPSKHMASSYTGDRYVTDREANIPSVEQSEDGDWNYGQELREPGIIPLHMALKNPMVVDAEGRNWDGHGGPPPHREDDDGNEIGPDHPEFDNDDYGHWVNTPEEWHMHEMVARARDTGHDGLIVHNVTDYGGAGDGGPESVYVAFEPDQIKHATQNTGFFDPNEEDIRKSELAKAHDPLNFKGIARATTPEGADHVDHTQVTHPPSVQESADLYTAHRSLPEPWRPEKGAAKEGITRKRVFKDAKGNTFMVKPFHEGVIQRAKGWQKFPIQGWAEMTNQALYHAAGIGDLHQKVHVAEHDMGPDRPREPALVIHMADKYEPIAHALHDVPGVTEAAAKVGLMDFLTANRDRHSLNALIPSDGHVEGRSPLLAIDHSRSFQYVGSDLHERNKQRDIQKLPTYNPEVFSQRVKDLGQRYARMPQEESLWGYMSGSRGLGHPLRDAVDPPGYNVGTRNRARLDRVGIPAFEWWAEAGPKVREEFNRRVEQLKDPVVRAHVKRNFNARADFLDERAKFGIENFGMDSWQHDTVPVYRPHERADDEDDR